MREENAQEIINKVIDKFNLNNQDTPVVLMLGGLPACGKSTFTYLLNQKFSFFILSKDIIRYKLAIFEHGFKTRFELQHCLESYSCVTSYIINLLSKYYSLVHSNVMNIDNVHDIINQEVAKSKDKNVIKHSVAITAYLVDTVNDIIKNKYNNGIILDSTHLSKKQRARYFGTAINRFPMYCVFFDIDARESKKRNHIRADRQEYSVPSDVIHEMNKIIEFPHISEGFIDILIINDDIVVNDNKQQIYNLQKHDCSVEELITLFPSFVSCLHYNQHNQHHALLLDEHLMSCANMFKNDDIKLFLTALLHDVGKVESKIKTIILNKDFEDLKQGKKLVVKSKGFNSYYAVNYNNHKEYNVPINIVTEDENHHYYNHQNVSAPLAYRDILSNGFDEDFAMTIYWMIFYHMDVSTDGKFCINNSILNKMKQKLSDEEIDMVKKFKVADIGAKLEDYHANN